MSADPEEQEAATEIVEKRVNLHHTDKVEEAMAGVTEADEGETPSRGVSD